MLSERLRRFSQFMVAGSALAAGTAVCVVLIKTKPAPANNDAYARVLEVAVESTMTEAEQFPIIGYGTVRPRKQIDVVPLVSGRLTHAHPNLAQGKIIPKGELLYELDATIYEAQVKQMKAEISGLESSLTRLDQEAANIDRRLENAQAMLAIDQNDYDTTSELHEKEDVGTRRDVDMTMKNLLRQKDVVAELVNAKELLPHQKAEINAKLEGMRAQLRRAEYELDATKIVCPFDARVEAVHARESQVVMAHLSIATLIDMSAFELSVGVDPRELRWLAPSIRPAALKQEVLGEQPDVNVRWSLHGQEFIWKGRVTRFERVNEKTRTLQMVVEVLGADMMARVDLGSGMAAPQLSIGMFCSAELPAKPLEETVMVPRHAIHENRWVYVFEPEPDFKTTGMGQLGRREISVLRAMNDRVLVDYRDRQGSEVCELKPGEQVVVSRLTKPVIGMRVKLRAGSEIDIPATTVTRASAPSDPEAQPFGSFPFSSALASHVLSMAFPYLNPLNPFEDN
ncbi:MAG: efflux RND transporter periplasmic adaptor subunit [Planctomycetota bacterium]|jgi:multidrug efflux pump subunit AcrA (membrane-fusion protein)